MKLEKISYVSVLMQPMHQFLELFKIQPALKKITNLVTLYRCAYVFDIPFLPASVQWDGIFCQDLLNTGTF